MYFPSEFPLHDGFYIDTRKSSERKIINSKWIPKNEKPPLRTEIIDQDDIEFVGSFMAEIFTKYNIVRKAADCKEMTINGMEKCIENPISLAAFNGDKLVAAELNFIYDDEELRKHYNFQRNNDPKTAKFIIKDDYAEELRNGPSNLKNNRISVLQQECYRQTGKFLPNDIKRLGVIKSVAVHPEYQGCGLGQNLINESIKLFHSFKCDYILSYCSAEQTCILMKRIGMEEIFSFPYLMYKENGKPVLGENCQGARTILLGKTEKLIKNLKEG